MNWLKPIASHRCDTLQQQVMPDDHSEVVPLLPIPNRTVKRLSADDSAYSRVKVGHRQATTPQTPSVKTAGGLISKPRLMSLGYTIDKA